jgi:ribosomal protein S18 acetylase RimI-like enzyme
MQHILDNPAFNALISGNSALSNGTPNVQYFSKSVSPFFGLKDNTESNFGELYNLVPPEQMLCFITPVVTEIPVKWDVLHFISGLQMVYHGEAPAPDEAVTIVPLSGEHIPQMLALTKLTNPGPFAERTIDFGHYYGIFNGADLVAMAGQRLHVFNYAEISAVCTHPDHLGKGYARQLLLHHIRRIKAAGDIPFLHVRADNERAINVYKSLGFETRRPIYFYIIKTA